MSKFRRHKRKDANHRELVTYFREAGATVDDVSGLPGLGYDLVVGYAGQVVLVEIKDGSKAPSDRKLTESEEAARERWGKKFAVVTSIADAQGLLANMARYGAMV